MTGEGKKKTSFKYVSYENLCSAMFSSFKNWFAFIIFPAQNIGKWDLSNAN